eukprot:m.51742 g.51742  ORF g.51742 m.51742 type:complete len:1027 (-) comp12646_c0_seq3:37-3117(-)
MEDPVPSPQNQIHMVMEILSSLRSELEQQRKTSTDLSNTSSQTSTTGRKRRASWRSAKRWISWKRDAVEGHVDYQSPEHEAQEQLALQKSLNEFASPMERLNWCISELEHIEKAQPGLISPHRTSTTGAGLFVGDTNVSDEDKTVVEHLQRLYSEQETETRDMSVIGSSNVGSLKRRSTIRGSLRRTNSETQIKPHLLPSIQPQSSPSQSPTRQMEANKSPFTRRTTIAASPLSTPDASPQNQRSMHGDGLPHPAGRGSPRSRRQHVHFQDPVRSDRQIELPSITLQAPDSRRAPSSSSPEKLLSGPHSPGRLSSSADSRLSDADVFPSPLPQEERCAVNDLGNAPRKLSAVTEESTCSDLEERDAAVSTTLHKPVAVRSADAHNTSSSESAEKNMATLAVPDGESVAKTFAAALAQIPPRQILRSMTISSPKSRHRRLTKSPVPRQKPDRIILVQKQKSLQDVYLSTECGSLDEETRIHNLARFRKLLDSQKDHIDELLQIRRPEVVDMLLRSDRWDLDVFQLESMIPFPLTAVALKHICDRRLLDKLPVDLATCCRFFLCAERLYKPYPVNSYHTNTHGADVLHTMACLLDSVPFFTPTEVFAAIVAAGLHDVAHPGYTNNFLIKTNHEFSLLYNDKSVLENYHASTTFKIMRDHPECNILANFPADQQLAIRRLIIDMIMGTDMTRHARHVTEFKEYVAVCTSKIEAHEHMNVPADVLGLETTVKERSLVLDYMLHCSDLSAGTKPWHLCYKWALRVLNEFWNEGDEEKRLGIPVGELNDRDAGSVPASQYGFLKFVCKPLWDEWNAFVSPGFDAVFMRNLEANMSLWEARREYESKVGAKTAARSKVQQAATVSSPSSTPTSQDNSAIQHNLLRQSAVRNEAEAGGRVSRTNSDSGDSQKRVSRGEQVRLASQNTNQATIPITRRRSQPDIGSNTGKEISRPPSAGGKLSPPTNKKTSISLDDTVGLTLKLESSSTKPTQATATTVRASSLTRSRPASARLMRHQVVGRQLENGTQVYTSEV